LAGVLPQQATTILSNAMQNLARNQSGALGFGAVLGLLLALWSARKGMSALMTATNIAYGEREQRSFVRQAVISLGLTLGAVLGFLLLLALAVIAPLLLGALDLPGILQPVIAAARWAVLWVF